MSYALLMASLLVWSFSLPFSWPFFFLTQFFFFTNYAMSFAFSELFLKKMMTEKRYVSTELMWLDGPIIVTSGEHRLAEFTLKNDKISIKLEIETHKGRPGIEYQSFNIDSIMIKPGKTYRVSVYKNAFLFKNEEFFVKYCPFEIDYYNFEDKFYLYKVK